MNADAARQRERLENALGEAATDWEMLAALLSLAREVGDGEPGRARMLAERAYLLAAALADEARQARSLHLQGHADYRLGARDSAQALYCRALELSRRSEDRAVEADCLHDLGLLATIQANHAEAMAYHLGALQLYRDMENAAGQAQTLNDLGNAHMGQDDLGRALPYYLESLKQREALGDTVGVGCSLNNIGNVHTALGDHARALDCYLRCLEVSRRTGATRLEARCQSNLTGCYIELGRLEDALETSNATYALARRHGYRSDECYALMAQGSTHKAAGRLALAAPLFREALIIAQSLSDCTAECQIQLLCGETAWEMEALMDARAAYRRAVEIAESQALRQYLFPAFRGLSQVCKAEGNFAQALAYHEKFHALEKEVLRDSADKRLQAMMIQMDVEKAQKEAVFSRREAELHRLKTVELAQTNQALRQANEENEQLVEELRAQADALERLATQDELTGLYNRRYLEGWLARVFDETKRGGGRLTVALLDVDDFKQINDRFGHQIGDEVLTTISHLMCQACRTTDVVARYGGEEFLLALPETTRGGAICERIRGQIAAYSWREIHPELAVTASIGFSDDLSVDNHERLLSLADGQLYAAKRAGRNRVCGQAILLSPA